MSLSILLRCRGNQQYKQLLCTVAEKDTGRTLATAAHPMAALRPLRPTPMAALGPPRLAAPAKNFNYDLATKNIVNKGLINY